jgi:acetyl esterase
VHPQTASFLELLALWAPPADRVPTVEELREVQRRRGPYLGERLELPQVTDLTVAGIPVRVYRPDPPGSGPLPALVYFHGGGWVIGSMDAVDPLCRKLAVAAGCVVVNVEYRLAPEHPFPAAVDDAWAVTADAIAHPDRYGADGRAVAVAGDSAGATLAAVTAIRARDEGVRLAHQVLVYPVTDEAMSTPSYAAYGSGYALNTEGMAWFFGMYAGDADRTDPRMSPLRAADLSGLAPATVITAECDVLRDEGEAYAERLAAAGNQTELTRYDGMVHSFFVLPELFDAAIAARQQVAGRLRAAFAAALQEGAPA